MLSVDEETIFYGERLSWEWCVGGLEITHFEIEVINIIDSL
jgi:hypothetical protein